MAAATKKDLDQLERSAAEAIRVVMGLLAEAAGSGKLALHFAAALKALKEVEPNSQRDRLLEPAFRHVLTKARNQHPESEAIQTLASTVLGDLQKH